MGYTVWYEGTRETPLTDAEKAILDANVAEWSGKLSETAEAYSWDIEEDGCKLSGWTKPGLDDDMDDDVDTLVDAVRALHAALPDWDFEVTDDYDTELYPDE